MRSELLYLMLGFMLISATDPARIPVASCVASSRYDCGVQIGQEMSSLFHRSIDTAKMKAFLDWTHSTESAKMLVDEFVQINRKAFPGLSDELAGMAKGADIDENLLFTANLAAEIGCVAGLPNWHSRFRGHTLPKRVQPKSCTDIHLSSSQVSSWGHNEDDVANESFTYLVNMNVTGDNEQFAITGYAYAPNLVGWAWGFNSFGFGQSCNVLFPSKCQKGLGEAFVARHVLESQSVEDAIARASVGPHALGQNFNVGSINSRDRQLMIETSPNGVEYRFISNKTGHHCNTYEIFNFSEGHPDPSSAHRLARIAELESTLQENKDILRILSDHKDPQYPIFRSGNTSDDCSTLSTVLFDIDSETVTMWNGWPKPPLNAKPLLMWDWNSMKLRN